MSATIFDAGYKPAAAQGIICCSLLIDVHGDWIGADHTGEKCGEYANQSPEMRDLICDALRANNAICPQLASYCEPEAEKDPNAVRR